MARRPNAVFLAQKHAFRLRSLLWIDQGGHAQYAAQGYASTSGVKGSACGSPTIIEVFFTIRTGSNSLSFPLNQFGMYIMYMYKWYKKKIGALKV